MLDDFWRQIDKILEVSKRNILTPEEKAKIEEVEQAAYESNWTRINSILTEYETELRARRFWVEKHVMSEGTRFRFSLQGYYGPGGFSSQFHVGGPLVLGIINPAGDALQGFYPNDLDQCTKIGADFDEAAFRAFVERVIRDYVDPRNLITTEDRRERTRDSLKGQ